MIKTLKPLNELKQINKGLKQFNHKKEYLQRKRELKQELHEQFCLNKLETWCKHVKDRRVFAKLVKKEIEEGSLGELPYDMDLLDKGLKNTQLLNIINKLFNKDENIFLSNEFKYGEIRSN